MQNKWQQQLNQRNAELHIILPQEIDEIRLTRKHDDIRNVNDLYCTATSELSHNIGRQCGLASRQTFLNSVTHAKHRSKRRSPSRHLNGTALQMAQYFQRITYKLAVKRIYLQVGSIQSFACMSLSYHFTFQVTH